MKILIAIIALSVNIEYKVPIIPLLKMIEVESQYVVDCISTNPNGTKDYGLMQLNGKYLDYYAWKFNGEKKIDVFNPRENITIGIKYLAWLKEQCGSWEGAFAAYNCGLTRLRSGNIPTSTIYYICKIF